MITAIREFIEAIRARQNNLFIVSGNVYDSISSENKNFSDFQNFLVALTAKKHPQCLSYDLFSGIKVIRGEENEIAILMNLKSSEVKDKNAVLIEAIKQAKLGGGNRFPTNPLEAFSCFDRLLAESKVPTVIIIDHAETLIPAQAQGLGPQGDRILSIALTKWSRSQAVKENGHLIILVCRRSGDLDEKVLDRIFQSAQIRLPKPDKNERVEFFQKNKVRESAIASLGNASAGLSYNDLSKIMASGFDNNNLDELLNKIFKVKEKVLQDEYGDLLEVMQVKNGFDSIGGLERSIAELKLISASMREGKLTLVPQGILFMGPPGTGKTVLAEAFAKEAGLNFVKPLDLKSMWVGQSERRMTSFLNALKDLSPVAVFIDEFDQSQGKRDGFDGDSGVTRNLFKKMLEVMSDTSLRGQILWIFATNRPDLIDPAMKRPGRCDLRIPFLSPDARQLALICKAAFKQYPDMDSEVKNWQPYSEQCRRFTGADMIEVIRRAWKHASENKRKRISEEDMEWACHDYKPQIIDKKIAAKMSLLALQTCSSVSLLPENWIEVASECIEILTGVMPKNLEKNFDEVIQKALDSHD